MKDQLKRWVLVALFSVITGELSLGSIPTSDASVLQSAPLSTVTIHLSDLRSGYTVQQQTWLSLGERSIELGVSTGRLRMNDWRAAYDAYYRRGSPEVDSTADQYSNSAGAHWGYVTYLHSVKDLGLYGNPPYSQQLALPSVGNESVAYGPTASNVGGWSGILFRRGNDVFNVAVANTGHDVSSALALAREVDGRIRSHGY